MSLSGLVEAFASGQSASQVAADAAADRSFTLSGPAALTPFVVAAVSAKRPVLAVTATTRECDELADALASLIDPDSVATFPAWETLPHERLSPRADTVGARLAVLRRLAHPAGPDDTTGTGTGALRVVVAPIRALLQPIARGLGDLEPVVMRAGDEIDMQEVVRRLVEIGYSRTDLVEKRGDLAVRGGIIDVFPSVEEHPLRVEFWGDTVEEVRWFRVADQRSLEVSEAGVWAPPCRELILTDDVMARAATLREERPELADVLGPISEGIVVEGMEALTPVLADGMESLLDVLAPNAHVIVCDGERVRARAHDLLATSEEFLAASWLNAAEGGRTPLDLRESAYRSIADVRALALEMPMPWSVLTPFVADEEGEGLVSSAQGAEQYRGETERLTDDIRKWLADHQRVVLITEGHGPAQRTAEVLRAADVPVRLEPTLEQTPPDDVVVVATGTLVRGFVDPESRLVVLTEQDVSGQKSSTKDMRRMPSRRRTTIDPLLLSNGDFIVHDQHGVGRYIEMVQRQVAGATREYLVIEYAPAKRGAPPDRLYVPTEQLDQVTRYVGGEAPTLHRLGGSDWVKAKGRARKAVKQIAAELIRLYSARMAAPGHAFGPDTPWQRELEDAFPYVETRDQLASIDEVKADMERPIPMDRLICGDVGYGKTEIAVRAAFKAVQDGRQVAVLVPTTLLVQQHMSTFAERYAPFPVVVKPLSRFQSDKEARAVLAGVTAGTVDVVIGTHRLLAKEVQFKDLGLVIVDEEQRFGVEHKEYLKQLRANVDVLTMSATPIPRTLEMAVTGIREMSTIQTPPEERHPILTFVGAYDEKQITAAIRRELLRDGQVFYIHNRVDSIERVASKIRELVPEARVVTAHGQMNEHVLEQVIVDFWDKASDVLVCTTIVESGLDISNANTLIVDRADVLGLGQLHQLRGRVGRARERAYAYFLYSPEKPLTETAYDRLATIAQNTDLGSGMAVAMKDLEIRGAGNLLGGEQSGHIAEVGFDLYVRLVGEAVAEFRGEESTESSDVRVELPVNAHLPESYIAEERLRLEAYKALAAATESDLGAVVDELVDRYGALPPATLTLVEVARLRNLARRAGLGEITLQGTSVRFAPVDLAESRQIRLTRLYPRSIVKPAIRTILVPRPTTARVGGTPLRDEELLHWARDLIEQVLLDDLREGTR